MMTATPAEHATYLLAQLDELKAAVAVTKADRDAKRAAILAAVQPDLDALDAEYAPMLDAAEAREADLTTQVKEAVLAAGETVRAGSLQAVYARGRETWDTRALKGYAAAHPEVLAFQTVGAPSVSLRGNVRD